VSPRTVATEKFENSNTQCTRSNKLISESRNFICNVTRYGKQTSLEKDIQHFNNQLAHTTLKNVELLKHFRLSKTAPTCFGLQGNHHQGATIST